MNTQFKQDILSIKDDLHAFALRLTDGNANEADDLLQETLLRLMTKWAGYLPGSNLKAWSFTVMRNIHINNIRHRNIEQHYLLQKENLLTLFRDDECGDFCDNEALYKNICEIMSTLPVEYSVPLRLLVSGYRYNEIAELLSLPLHTVKNRIHVARVKLRVIIDDY